MQHPSQTPAAEAAGKKNEDLMRQHMTFGGKIYGYYSEPVFQPRQSQYHTLKIKGHELKISPPEAKVIMQIFKDFAESGLSSKAITKRLNAQLLATGHPEAPRGKKWSTSTLMGSKALERGILRQELYAGFYKKRDATISVPCLAIVPLPLWEKAQERLALAAKVSQGKFTRGKPTYSKYLLTGLMKCSSCQSNIVIVKSGRHPKYGCATSRNSDGLKCGNKMTISKDRLEDAFFNELAALADAGTIAGLKNTLIKHPVTGKSWLFQNVQGCYLITSGTAWSIELQLKKAVNNQGSQTATLKKKEAH